MISKIDTYMFCQGDVPLATMWATIPFKTFISPPKQHQVKSIATCRFFMPWSRQRHACAWVQVVHKSKPTAVRMSLSEFTGPKEDEGEDADGDYAFAGESYNSSSFDSGFASKRQETHVPTAWRHQVRLLGGPSVSCLMAAFSPPELALYIVPDTAALPHLRNSCAVSLLSLVGPGIFYSKALTKQSSPKAPSIAQPLQLINLLHVSAMTQDAQFLPPRRQPANEWRKQQSVLNSAAFPSLDQAVSGDGSGDSAAISVLNALRHMQCGTSPHVPLFSTHLQCHTQKQHRKAIRRSPP